MKYSYIEAYAYNNDHLFVGLGEIANGIVENNEDGIGNYSGTITKTFTITAVSIKDAKVNLSTTSYNYNGKAKKGATFTSGSCKYKVTGTSTVAFNGIKSTKTTKVTIPKNVKYGGKTFKVTSIAEGALKKKTKVTIGSAVTTIEDKAFKNCTGLKSITIPSKVTKIDKQVFYGCKKLKIITIKSTKLKTVGKEALKETYSKATIKVPKSKLSAYMKLLKGKGQGSKVKITKYN